MTLQSNDNNMHHSWISGYITTGHLSPTESPFIYGTREK